MAVEPIWLTAGVGNVGLLFKSMVKDKINEKSLNQCTVAFRD